MASANSRGDQLKDLRSRVFRAGTLVATHTSEQVVIGLMIVAIAEHNIVVVHVGQRDPGRLEAS